MSEEPKKKKMDLDGDGKVTFDEAKEYARQKAGELSDKAEHLARKGTFAISAAVLSMIAAPAFTLVTVYKDLEGNARMTDAVELTVPGAPEQLG